MGFSQEGITYANFLNSSLSIVDDPNCYKGKFIYDPRCRFWYMDVLNDTSFKMLPPRISVGSVTPYLSQFACQKLMFFNKQSNKNEVHHVICIEAMLSYIQNFFQNVVHTSKQWYIIDPRTGSIVFNSKKEYNYTNNKVVDNFHNTELQYLKEKEEARSFQQLIDENYNKWVYQISNNYSSLEQMIDLNKQQLIMPYLRNGTSYRAILNPVFVSDDIPKFVTQFTQQKGQQIEIAYLQINIISDEDLREQTKELIEFSSLVFIIIQAILGALSIIFMLITLYYAIMIRNLIYSPITRLTEVLNRINQLKKMVEISEIIIEYEKNAEDIFLSYETYQLYESFFEVFQMLSYTSENFFVENESKTLIGLCKRVDFFRQFQNYHAVGITHNNIGNILLNQQHYFQAYEHFSSAIVYAKYEIQLFCKTNPRSQFLPILSKYCYDEIALNTNKSLILEEIKSKNSSIPRNHSLSKEQSLSKQFDRSSKSNQKQPEIKLETVPSKVKINNYLTFESGILTYERQQTKKQSISNEKVLINNLKSKEKSTQQIQVQINIQKEKEEEKQQFYELIYNLYYRKSNQIVSLLAFQESLDQYKQNKKQQHFYNFWYEIKQLIKELLQISSYLPQAKTLDTAMLSLISKCHFRLNHFKKAEQVLIDTKQILKFLELQEQQNISKSKSPINTKILNSPQKCNTLKDSNNDLVKKKRSKSTHSEQGFQDHHKFSNFSNQQQQNQTQNSKQISSGLQFLKPDSSFQQDRFKQIAVNKCLSPFQSSVISPLSRGSLDSTKNIVNGNKESLFYHQNFLLSEMPSEKSPLNQKKSNFDKRFSEQSASNQHNGSMKVIQKQISNIQKKNKMISLNKMPADILKQILYFNYAEYLIYKEDHRNAAEVLTQLLEKSKTFMSHMPLRIVCKLKQIFDLYGIKDKFLVQEYSRFNKSIQMQVVFAFECNYQSENSSFQEVNKNEDQENQYTQKQLQFLNELIKSVLVQRKDKISIQILDQNEGYVHQYMELNSADQIRNNKLQILQELQMYISHRNTNFIQKLVTNLDESIMIDYSDEQQQQQQYNNIKSINFLESIPDSQISDDSLSSTKKINVKDITQFKLITNLNPFNNKNEEIDLQDKFSLPKINLIQKDSDLVIPIEKDNKVCAKQSLVYNRNQIDQLIRKQIDKLQKESSINQIEQSVQNPTNNQFFFSSRITHNSTSSSSSSSSSIENESFKDSRSTFYIDINKNYVFHHFARKSISQLLSNKLDYQLIEFEHNLHQLNNLNQLKPCFYDEIQFFTHQQKNKQDQILRFIIYQTQEIGIIENSLFKKLCKILIILKIQIIILSYKKGNNFLEQNKNLTYKYKNEEVIKVFYSFNKINQYLSFKRENFQKYTYLTYIQHF